MTTTRRRLIRNAARCLVCGDVIESRDRREVSVCSCKNAYVSGGLTDPETGAADGFVEDLCEYTP